MGILAFLFIGAVSGWLAGKIMKGEGFGLIGNIVIGIIGAIIGGYTFNFLGIVGDNGFIGSIATSTIGAVILLFVVSLFKK
ncbi:MAG: GlsB/YeaQ/YmgE family stress response membrane protein [Bacteroidales bacterium]|nr:GlsB/YeaQ/YmgE family stress response membrane protein [Bacteroidales bacterium]